ncbi:30S ribosomal protein S17 [Candidatus Peregrinibacteria bacterium CG10_big_fil_rev_8_21_14_0_10_49_10]|nr:MAG: 30S ribosomal protein S17 [Candidatus Peregrinibacteria bacterium CG10_big_fil_rev_8_21_14_0_10_49_10]
MKKKKGTITSTKMTNTVTVTVDSLSFHAKYKKRFKVSKKFLADPAGHEVRNGDLVLIGECRPLSKRKHFRVLEILKKAAAVDDVLEEADVEKAIHRAKKEIPAEDASPEQS